MPSRLSQTTMPRVPSLPGRWVLLMGRVGLQAAFRALPCGCHLYSMQLAIASFSAGIHRLALTNATSSKRAAESS